MPLNKQQLKQDWKAILTNSPSTENNVDQVVDMLVDSLDNYIRTATVIGSTTNGATLTNTQII